MAHLLAGDIGGTKTVLGIYSRAQGPRQPLKRTIYSSAEFSSLKSIIADFLQDVASTLDVAVVSVAGPVIAGEAELTNLPWRVSEEELKKSLGFSKVAVLNDLLSTAYAVPHLDSSDLYTLNSGKPVNDGAIAIIAPGTGLGEAFLVREGSSYQGHASEGGHADFAPVNGLQIDLLRHLMTRYSHVSYERVCSGSAIQDIYNFLKEEGHGKEPEWLAAQLAESPDRNPVIVQAALDASRKSHLCSLTLDTFVSILGAEAGNLALKVLATGGVYLGGGIPPRILPALKHPNFMSAFRNKGRSTDLLTGVPVHVILEQNTALLGSALFGFATFTQVQF